jgi:hypothetical protein
MSYCGTKDLFFTGYHHDNADQSNVSNKQEPLYSLMAKSQCLEMGVTPPNKTQLIFFIVGGVCWELGNDGI